MLKTKPHTIFSIVLCLTMFQKLYAQLGFCQGNSGDPIFEETFGTGLSNGPPLPAGTTTYGYWAQSDPQDGQYTIASSTFLFGWNLPSDHTPGDTDGKALIVNASFTAGEFYKTSINGLCENTTYEFSSWLINILPSSGCGGSGIPVNVKFEIWDDTDTSLLASGDTGDIFSQVTPTWEQYGLVFQTLPGQTAVILKMINNGVGGCGNDLAIDDIVFKSCGDSITVEDTTGISSTSICSTQSPFNQSISAVPDNVVFNSHFYQWQFSTDGINWVDLVGETAAALNIAGVTTTTFYRAKVAEFAANLTNSDCITFSDVYEVNITQAPPQPAVACWETAIFDDNLCDWVVSGTQPVQPATECWETATFNNTTCAWEVTGTQPAQPTLECWESAIFNDVTCSWEVSGTQPPQPTLECWETAIFNDTSCSWEVTGTQPPPPNNLECWETATFNNTICSWDITGTQPPQPTTECWETATFNNTTCSWELSGTQPPQPTNLECWETASFNNISCSWEVTGTQPVQPSLQCWETASFNDMSCTWEISGTQPPQPTTECWETAIFNDSTCSWEVFGTEPEEPTDLLCWQSTLFNETLCEWEIIGDQPLEFRDEQLFLCEGESITLEAISNIENPTYQWESGEETFSISVDSSGTYVVEVTDNCFTEIITFTVIEIEIPVIDSVVSDGNSIIVNIANPGDYVYSLDGLDYQISNVFSGVESGSYTLYVKSNICEVVITTDHIHFYIQKFITPNGDGNNDTFNFNLAPYYNSTEVYIFNRFGKLIYSANNSNVKWDGTFIGNKLPSSDYWYKIVIDNKEYKGHFTLKR